MATLDVNTHIAPLGGASPFRAILHWTEIEDGSFICENVVKLCGTYSTARKDVRVWLLQKLSNVSCLIGREAVVFLCCVQACESASTAGCANEVGSIFAVGYHTRSRRQALLVSVVRYPCQWV